MEHQLSRIRQQHQRFRDQWDDASGYFQQQNVRNQVQSSLMSQNSFRKRYEIECVKLYVLMHTVIHSI